MLPVLTKSQQINRPLFQVRPRFNVGVEEFTKVSGLAFGDQTCAGQLLVQFVAYLAQPDSGLTIEASLERCPDDEVVDVPSDLLCRALVRPFSGPATGPTRSSHGLPAVGRAAVGFTA